ncbi:penicillin-binding protein [Planobispora rosea]|uniref:Penicillin-binding protein n=1 Tax=Planobispora rosea TaxID=35762 RepID=A0A8J3S681_PLARO|nr:penicillin-binding transpeptidase domain-containing protein [Planobispora rosea]GGS78826.1 penicillin-binding protein [Planobispora rosea]GIH85719.1 penicillin-binding protein [Planobispora rosea]
MRTRPVLVLVIVFLAIVGGSVYALTRPTEPRTGNRDAPVVSGGVGGADEAARPARPQAGAEDVARTYLTAWEGADLATMDRLVIDSPGDFIERHHAFSQELGIESLALSPGTITFRGEQAAEMPFQGVRQVRELGAWSFSSTLRLVAREGRWWVDWAPETLHPALKDGGRLRLRDLPAEPAELVTRSKDRFPHDSGAENYLKVLAPDLSGQDAEGVDGLALEAVTSAGEVQRLLEKPSKPGRKIVTTFSRTVQAAAARALDGVERPAAIVAVESGTGEVLAVADRLGGRNAFLGLYPPGSTFKVVTAAALLSAGLTPDSPVSCPASYAPPGGASIPNASSVPVLGATTLVRAFAVSCNTTFVDQSTRTLQDGGLVRAAELLGFNKELAAPAETCTIKPHANNDQLASDAIGQNSVLASPLCMALVAAAAESGTWRQPSMMRDRERRGGEVPLPPGVAEGLRTMMRAVVTEGSASAVPLPEGTAGKTGTAEIETGAGIAEHAWFIGYREGTAFAVLVERGGSGAATALPIAARFLNSL